MQFAAAIGRMNIDLLYSEVPRMPNLGEEEHSKGFEIQLDGGATAIITALTRLEVDSRLGTFLSNDFMSNYAKKILEQSGIKYRNIYRGSKIPIAVTSIVTFPEDRCFVTYAPDRTEFECTDEDIYGLYTGSKVCLGLKGHGSVFRKLSSEGTQLVYDVAWSDYMNIDDLRETLKYVNVFAPNLKEALKLTGKSTTQEALDEIGRYVEHVIIKLGKYGCITRCGGSLLHIPALDVFDTVDTTGAGDNFLAGVMFGLLKDWSIEQCIKKEYELI